jgi:hypothetical protein
MLNTQNKKKGEREEEPKKSVERTWPSQTPGAAQQAFGLFHRRPHHCNKQTITRAVSTKQSKEHTTESERGVTYPAAMVSEGLGSKMEPPKSSAIGRGAA